MDSLSASQYHTCPEQISSNHVPRKKTETPISIQICQQTRSRIYMDNCNQSNKSTKKINKFIKLTKIVLLEIIFVTRFPLQRRAPSIPNSDDDDNDDGKTFNYFRSQSLEPSISAGKKSVYMHIYNIAIYWILSTEADNRSLSPAALWIN